MSRNNRSTLIVLVFATEAGNLSYYGNPSRIVHTSRGTFKTMANAGFVYGFENDGGFVGHKVELTLTPAGRITNMRKLKKAENGGLRDEVAEYHHFEPDYA